MSSECIYENTSCDEKNIPYKSSDNVCPIQSCDVIKVKKANIEQHIQRLHSLRDITRTHEQCDEKLFNEEPIKGNVLL